MVSIYRLKPAFQRLLLPAVRALAAAGVTANQVTLAACAASAALGAGLYAADASTAWFALIPLWMLARMALNAADGMLARDFGQRSMLGAYLNELTDVVSDAALLLPFARLPAVDPPWLAAVAVLAALSELAGVLGQTVGASRRYDGPMGKSDRAFVFGALGLAAALWRPLPAWAGWAVPAVALLTFLTVCNRVRAGLQEASDNQRHRHDA